MINNEVKELSDFIMNRAPFESEYHPVDRGFLEPFLDDIKKLDRNEFLLYNLEYSNITYASSLFVCLPELWEDISLEEMINISRGFTKAYSYFPFIYFTYKFMEINSIKLIKNYFDVGANDMIAIRKYIQAQYNTFLKNDVDDFFFNVKAFGISSDQWMYVKQRMLIDNRIEPAILDLHQLRDYVNEF